ncbi:hypothetical protein Dsin_002460 [Dipteronia sinensis]|uniref:Uncharacterized protein n=1 Tax=Dipteronia sinensis TaxID=43782 RepID=A0AAE0B765_9ROSI|nr:hypothetical protein Dsin_002460 [Dipteronia sinensis]
MAESECPVCLQSYNGDDTIPRVLGCGHSACESCLLNLPQKYTLTIRCPACNVLVKYPPQGPTSLPKNIELLRLLDPKPPPQNVSRNDRPGPHFDFLPSSCSPDFYSSWKQYILPNDAVLLLQKSQDEAAVSLGSLKEVGKSQKVSLVKVVSLVSDQADSVFKYSYFWRIIRCLGDMRVQDTDELASLFIASLHETKICRVLGLWADLEDDCLYLVCQRLNQSLQNLDCLRNEDGLINSNGLSVFVTMGLEICEAVLALSKQGLIAGCLGFSCFTLDDFGHLYVDSSDIIVMGRKVVTSVVQVSCAGRRIKNEQLGVFFSDLLKSNVFLALEVLFELLSIEGIGVECGGEFKYSVEYGSDVWSLACVLIELLVGKQFTQELIDYIHRVSAKATEGNSLDCFGMYTGWVEKVSSLMEAKLGTEFVCLQQMLCQCLNFDPVSRPLLTDVWKCIRELIFKPEFDNMIKLDNVVNMEDKGHCLVLGEMCWLPKRNSETHDKDDLSGVENSAGADIDQVEAASGVHHLVEGISEKKFKFKDMQGHLDCVTGLAIGGGFLFSSSFDKTVHVWSLQDFSHVHTFQGHDHKVMAVVYVDEEAPLCISGDSGGGIYVWSICVPLGQEPLKKWNELKDWRYSGIHAMTTSGKYLYTGSGDKTIKAWSFLDGTLVCTMNGHKSVVATLAVCNGVLYSGSWDGTIRLWSLSDHSLLTVLGEDNARTVSSILSLSADQHSLVTSHETGSIKVWKDDVFMKSTQIHNGSILAICMEEKWLFTGGWDQTVKLQELIGDDFQVDAIPIGSIPCGSVITALLYWQGKLFVGYADRTVKVYYYEK